MFEKYKTKKHVESPAAAFHISGHLLLDFISPLYNFGRISTPPYIASVHCALCTGLVRFNPQSGHGVDFDRTFGRFWFFREFFSAILLHICCCVWACYLVGDSVLATHHLSDRKHHILSYSAFVYREVHVTESVHGWFSDCMVPRFCFCKTKTNHYPSTTVLDRDLVDVVVHMLSMICQTFNAYYVKMVNRLYLNST